VPVLKAVAATLGAFNAGAQLWARYGPQLYGLFNLAFPG